MDKERIGRSLKRIAYQITERNREEKKLFLSGINIRGFAVASAIKSYLDLLYGDDHILCEQLMVKDEPISFPKEISFPNEYFILLIDDVIFTGKTMFTTLTQIARKFSLSEIHTAALIDRGHRRFPIKAEFTGMQLPTKLDEHVNVKVTSEGELQNVILYKA